MDNVLSAEQLEACSVDLGALNDGAGFAENDNGDANIRTDAVIWLHSDSRHGPGLHSVVATLRALPASLEDAGFQGPALGVPIRNQLARYRPGAYYTKHTDSPVNDNWFQNILTHLSDATVMAREITMILYLNPHWKAEDGAGNLRIHCLPGAEKPIVEVEPLGGRLVVFQSRQIVHEVVPTSLTRVALTLWAGGEACNDSMLWLRKIVPEIG